MPKLAHEMRLEQSLSADAALVLQVLLAELNTVRAALDLPQLTDEQIRQRVKQYRRDHPGRGRPSWPI